MSSGSTVIEPLHGTKKISIFAKGPVTIRTGPADQVMAHSQAGVSITPRRILGGACRVNSPADSQGRRGTIASGAGSIAIGGTVSGGINTSNAVPITAIGGRAVIPPQPPSGLLVQVPRDAEVTVFEATSITIDDATRAAINYVDARQK